MRDVLVLCPQQRDIRAVRAAGLDREFRIRFVGDDLDAKDDAFEPTAFLAECDVVPADGVIGTKDRSALLASLVAERRGLPGPTAKAMLACQHKPTSRRLQQEVAHAATPQYAILNGFAPPFAAPWFVKPVVGRLSQGAHRAEDVSDLSGPGAIDRYRTSYARIAALAGLDPELVNGFLIEEFVAGDEVTLEGYVHEGRVTTIGITDSVKYEGTNSFERFEYPSGLPASRQAELAGLAERVLPALGFDGGFFNVEFVVPATGPAQIVEVNGRIASQFAPLVEAVEGQSTYEALLRLATGEDPGWQHGQENGVAISYCLRVFEDAYVRDVPEAQDGLEVLVRPGLRLSDQGLNDPHSFRLAIFSEWAPTREEAVARCRERVRELRFELR